MTDAAKPICGKTTLEGPKYGRIVAYHGHPCRRKVRNEGDRCWQHGGPRAPGTLRGKEPIMVPCEGSGCPAHLWGSSTNTTTFMGTCSMCGHGVACNGQGIAPHHLREDILAQLERGDYG